MFLGLLPEIVATDCTRCSPEQVTLTRSLVKFIGNNRPDEYRLLQNLYDPKVKYILLKLHNTSFLPVLLNSTCTQIDHLKTFSKKLINTLAGPCLYNWE